ncbi:MAG: Cyc2-like cytochrome [Candidatus Gallionella acididurans]|uniref:Cyc2-like cytochrome n=1 Tax=Candidatus Gallionella acididurans TaxID=1796491 RepID=A0A139BT99_9PROT|nr:MAG: Cyc2-like cytochrome [Candidatus Gallionella acididurans]
MQFKNTLWAVFALLSAALWAPQANAIPAFARQVGMACSACHYQHFPVLNSFGRAFKEGGFTMIGAQEKIEDTTAPGVSIPAVLNAALVGYIADTKTNGPTATAGTAKSTNDNSLQIPQQVSLFLAGRAGEHTGFEAEINLTPGAGGTIPDGSIGLIRFKVPFVYDVGNVKAGLVPFSTGLGAADSFEVLNTGAVAVHTFNQSDSAVVSAQQYIGTATAASGLAFIASNDNFFANFAKWGANQGAGTSGSPTSNYLRAAWTTSLIPGFDSAIGFQAWTGTSGLDNIGGVSPMVTTDTKATAIDAQMMGDVGGLPLLLIASYANAPASDVNTPGVNQNLFNASGLSKKSLNIGAELGVIPGVATVQLGMRRANSGGYVDAATAASGNATDNAILIGATYNFALNIRGEVTYAKSSGSMYNAANAAAAGAAYTGTNFTMIDLAFGF